MVLRGEIHDYFQILPAFDQSYLKVQIWRAIRTAADRHPRSLPRPEPKKVLAEAPEPRASESTSPFQDKRALAGSSGVETLR